MRTVLYCVLALSGAVLLWLLLDRLHTVVLESPRLDRFRYDNGVLAFGSWRPYTMTSQFGWAAALTVDDGGRVALASGGRSVELRLGYESRSVIREIGSQ